MELFQPLGDKILAKPEEKPKEINGIHLPDTVKNENQRAIVVAIGPGKLLENGQRTQMPFKKDMVVIYSKYAGSEVFINKELHIILQEKDILGYFED